jgi:hypothetical protein
MVKENQEEEYELAEIFSSGQNKQKRAEVCSACDQLLYAAYGRALCPPLKVFCFFAGNKLFPASLPNTNDV